MLDELPEVFRSVITLIDIHGLDYMEAARALNVPIGTVKSRLARARLQMQMKLQDAFEGPVDIRGSSINRNAEDGVLLS
jgi:RNA polymerase sigma-70 factor (ECF subfamily)